MDADNRDYQVHQAEEIASLPGDEVMTEIWKCLKVPDLRLMPEKDRSLSSRLIRLFTAYPCAGTNDADFGLTLPAELSDRSYAIVVEHVEFRRKCMNQGFDNLLELLAMHKEGFDKTGKVVDKMCSDGTELPEPARDEHGYGPEDYGEEEP